MIKLYKGKKVHYKPGYGDPENGIVKSIAEDNKHAFVVYNCAGDWDNYENYTAARTEIKDLRSGWHSKAKTNYKQ